MAANPNVTVIVRGSGAQVKSSQPNVKIVKK